jgi:hypothetical protein
MGFKSSIRRTRVVYSDKWLTLRNDGTLTIQKYRRFTLTSTLQVSQIKSITPSSHKYNRREFEGCCLKITFVSWQENRNSKARYQSVVIKTNGSASDWIGVRCEDVDKFLDEVGKMGVEVLERTDPEKEKE